MKNWFELMLECLKELDVDMEAFNKLFVDKVKNNVLEFPIGEGENLRTVKKKLQDIEKFK